MPHRPDQLAILTRAVGQTRPGRSMSGVARSGGLLRVFSPSSHRLGCRPSAPLQGCLHVWRRLPLRPRPLNRSMSRTTETVVSSSGRSRCARLRSSGSDRHPGPCRPGALTGPGSGVSPPRSAAAARRPRPDRRSERPVRPPCPATRRGSRVPSSWLPSGPRPGLLPRHPRPRPARR